MSSAPLKGLFITLEGGEGSGKSTLLNYLSHYLIQRGYTVLKTREPGGSKLGEAIRRLLLHSNPSSYSISHLAELLLFLASRAQHVEEIIEPALLEGHIVLCDRFNDSTIAYQGMARGLDLNQLHYLCDFASKNLEPQLTLFLDVEPEIGLARVKKVSSAHVMSGRLDRIEQEKIDFHERVRQAFHKLLIEHPNRIVCLDASQPQQTVFDQAIKQVDKLLAVRFPV